MKSVTNNETSQTNTSSKTNLSGKSNASTKSNALAHQHIESRIKHFFDDYQQRFAKGLNGDDVAGEAVAAFAEYFVESSPAGVIGGKNDKSFLKAVPESYDKYRSIGTKSMKISSLAITPIDELHSMSRVHWVSRYDKKGKELVVEFDVSYLLRHTQNEIVIFAYITGDEEQVLKENGLI